MTKKLDPNRPRKSWTKFVDKIEEYKSLDVSFWSEYQLLGYWCALTRMPLDDDGNYPRDNNQVVQMRILIRKIAMPSYPARGSKDLPKHYSPETIKMFLDWVWDEMCKKRLPCHSLSIVSGDRMTWIEKWTKYNAPEKTFDPAMLDIGD